MKTVPKLPFANIQQGFLPNQGYGLGNSQLRGRTIIPGPARTYPPITLQHTDLCLDCLPEAISI